MTTTNQQPEERPDLSCIEAPLSEDTVVETTDRHGQPMFFFRLEVTGLFPRRIGPFPDRETAITCLDQTVDGIYTLLQGEHKEWLQGFSLGNRDVVVVEDELGQAYLNHPGKKENSKHVRPRTPSKRKAAQS